MNSILTESVYKLYEQIQKFFYINQNNSSDTNKNIIDENTNDEEMEEIETGAGKMKKYKFRLRDPSFRWPSGVLTITKELVDPSAYTIREILGDVTSSTMGAETNADLGDDGSSSVTEILPLDRNDNMSVDTSVTELLSSVDELE